ncbi:type II secretion system protein GspM, partial [Porticoccus sp. GXU_MW_L64]
VYHSWLLLLRMKSGRGYTWVKIRCKYGGLVGQFWMQSNSHAPQIQQLAAVPETNVSDKPLMESTTGAAKTMALDINRLQPEGDNLRVWFTQVSFDKSMRLFATLAEKHSVNIQQITVEKTVKPGIVNIQCLLQQK